MGRQTEDGVQAAVMDAFGQGVSVRAVDDPVIENPTDVIVTVRAAGICRTDIETLSGAMVGVYGIPAFPYIAGHETVGVVQDVGSAVVSVTPGDAVLLHPLTSCGRCSGCRSGRDMYCTDSRFAGVDGRNQGGWAEMVRVGERALVRAPADADFPALAPLTDAGLTAYHAVERLTGALRADSHVLLLGLGGVGVLGLQMLRSVTSAHITAIDSSSDRSELGRSLSADDVLVGNFSTDPDSLRNRMGARRFDVVIDFAGSPGSAQFGYDLLTKGGVLSVVGVGGRLEVDTLQAAVDEVTVLGNIVGSYRELEVVAGLHGKLTSPVTTFPLSEAPTAVEAVMHGEVRGRAVLVP